MDRFITKPCSEDTRSKVKNVLQSLYRMSKDGLGHNAHFYPPIPCTGLSYKIGKRVTSYLQKNVNHLELEDYFVSKGGRQLNINFFWGYADTISVQDTVLRQQSRERGVKVKKALSLIDATNIEHVKVACKILNAMTNKDVHTMIVSVTLIKEWADIPRDVAVIRDAFCEFSSWNGDVCRANGWID